MAEAAQAQTASDVVVMRRSLDPKTRTYGWVPGQWTQCSNSCGAGQQTRSVQCMMNGKLGTPEVNCTADRPADTQACYDIQGCSYTWQPGEWTDAQGCGQVVETRDLTCLRGDGKTVPNDQCAQPQPDTTREVRDLRTCSYEWKEGQWSAWSGECQTAATSTREVWCERSNGEKVTDAECSASGSKPAASRSEDRYGQCGYSWEEKPWGAWSSSCQTGATRSREVVCRRSNGDVVADSFCGASGAKPVTSETGDQYGSCTYSWKPLEWGAVVPACGASTRSRIVQCIRSNGDVVGEGSCASGDRPADQEAVTDYSTCTYAWSEGSWSAPSNSCGDATSTRGVTCLSSDGRTVADSYCSGQKPTTSRSSYETSGCTYRWNESAPWSAPVPACGATVQNRAITCLRSDGQTVPDASCDQGSRPAGQKAATDYSTCTYGWTATSWGAWSTACGQATQGRTVTCQSSDGRTVADSFCDAGSKPAVSQSAYQTSGCGYSWQTGAFGSPTAACGASVQTRDVWCLRSDGERVADGSCAPGSRPSPTQGATDYSTCSYSWSMGGWSAPSATCGMATQTRSVTCLRSDGTTVADASCTGAGSKPVATQSSVQTGSCTYARVNPTAWGGWDNACSGSARRTRTYQCQRSDGTMVGGAECTSRGIDLSETETGANYTNACSGYFTTGAWSDYSSHCSASATRTRSVTCYRSGDNVFAGDQYCNDRGVETPARSETAAVYDQCGYSWKSDAWGTPAAACGTSTQNRAVWCERSDGTTVDGSLCGANRPASSQAVNDYSACSYGWAYNGWNTTSHTCGDITQSRSVWCQRSDGTSVADGFCGAGKPETTQSRADYSSCSYTAVNPSRWSSWSSSCSANASRSRSYDCRRADGVIVADSECTTRGISLSESQRSAVYDGCSYSVTGWSSWSYASSCSTSTTATQTATGCRRSDGTTVSVSECSNNGVATTQSTQTSNLAGCGYSWQTSGWSAQTGQCGTGSQTRDVWCQRTDGTRVDGSLCGGTKPSGSSPYTNYDSCTYRWTPGTWSGWSATCGEATRNRAVWCDRSDGTRIYPDSPNNEWGKCYSTPYPANSESRNVNCSYRWTPGPWSAWSTTCGDATRNRSVDCDRSDGVRIYPNSPNGEWGKCYSTPYPANSESAYISSGCTVGYPAGTTISNTALYATCYSSAPYYYGCTYINGIGYVTQASCSGSMSASQCASGTAVRVPVYEGTANGQCATRCR